MGTIQLHSNTNDGITYISNVFIDSYMPSANGTFVKIYLYLLRCLQQTQVDLSISHISDHFDCTEGDVVRALKYWEKVNLLSLIRDNNGQITDIQFLEPKAEKNEEENTEKNNSFKPGTNNTLKTSNETKDIGNSPVSAANQTLYHGSGKGYTTSASQAYVRMDYSEQDLHSLQQDSAFGTILKVVQDYLERPLSPQHIQLVAFLYRELKFSDELIYHLFEYCINRGKRRPNYIEKVAISWAEANVKTPDDAVNASAEYNADYSIVCKAFGLNRMPGAVERQYIDRWVKEFGFDRNIIEEACNRTLLKIQKPDFKYANGILEGWHKSGVRKFADIAKQDALHKTKQQPSVAPKTSIPNNNKFNSFPQRNYSQEDFSSLEKRLLKKSMNK